MSAAPADDLNGPPAEPAVPAPLESPPLESPPLESPPLESLAPESLPPETREAPETAEAMTDRPPVLPEPTPVPLLNAANLLTVSRLVLVPVFLLALFVQDGHDTGWRLIAAGIFAVASITDHVDGRLARKHGLITDFGKIADPIADKALTGSALIGLSVLGELAWWVTIVIAVREIGVTLLRFWVIRHGVIPASPGGKLKTLVQIIAIGAYILPFPAWFHPVAVVIMGIAVALTVVTGLDYVVRAVRLRARGKRAVAS